MNTSFLNQIFTILGYPSSLLHSFFTFSEGFMNVCTGLLGVFLVGFVPTVTQAGVPIAKSERVHDRWGDRCGWCALETMARYFEITELYQLAETHPGPATLADLESTLDRVNVNYRVQDAGCRNKEILNYAVRENLGAIVGFRERTPGGRRHLVVLVDYGPDEVRVLDSNDADGRIRTMPLKRFLSWWDGSALVIEPEEAQRIK
jgi:ABC-type bacteriocin/lantibiotic exporter with double-glycine peptidase domain